MGKCDYVTVDSQSKMGAKINSVIRKPKDFFYPLDWGSETIDYICNSPKISTEKAKESLGLKDYYTITCGYNAFPAQKHEKIIDAISKVRKNLPEKLVLLFPVTYGFDDRAEYIMSLKQKCKSLDIKALFFDNYLSLSELYNLRMATDMLVHVQPTDVGASSIQEYILCGKKIIHGSWVSYPHLEKYSPLFYYPVDELNDLSDVIVKSYLADPIDISQGLIEDIESRGWNTKMKLWDDFFSSIVK